MLSHYAYSRPWFAAAVQRRWACAGDLNGLYVAGITALRQGVPAAIVHGFILSLLVPS